MRRAGVDVQFYRHAGVTQAVGIVDIFIGETIQRADREIGRRQATQLSGTRGGGVVRHGVAREVAKIAVPAVAIRDRRPHRIVPLARDRDLAVVNHRINQGLKGDRQFTAIAREQSESRRQAGTGAGAADADACDIDTKLIGVSMQPLQARVTVFERTGIATLGGERVVHRGADAAQTWTPAIETRIVAAIAAENETAAVHPVNAG